jgi:hypothetical protein
MKWRLRFLWMKTRPLATFGMLVAVPFLPVVPWLLAAGPGPIPMPAEAAASELLSLADPIPTGAAEPVRGPSPPLDPAGVRKLARGWMVRPIDGSEWKLLMTDRFAVRGDLRTDDLQAVGAFAERFLDSIHEQLKGDLTDLRLSIRAFAREDDFLQWASCRHVEASEWFYDRRGGEIAILFGSATEVSTFCDRLMRGVALEYIDRVLEYQGSQDIADVLAAWFADYEVVKGRVTPRCRRGDPGDLLRIGDPARAEAARKVWSESAP